jgi:hypothetical protein
MRKNDGHLLPPMGVRFRHRDYEALRVAAAKDGEPITVYLRELVMTRVVLVEKGLDRPKLLAPDMRADGEPTEVATLRFSPAATKRLEECAAIEGLASSSWVRSVALTFLAERARKAAAPMARRAAAGA